MSLYEQIVNDGLEYVNGLTTTWASNTTLTIGTGQCRDSTNVFDIFVNTPLTLSLSSNGVNGLDTGTVAPNTLYYEYVIYDNTNNLPTASLLSLSNTLPYRPGGYSSFALIGAWATNSSSQFYLMYQYGINSWRRLTYDAPVPVLTSGTATTATAVPLGAVVPAFSNIDVTLRTNFVPATAGHQLIVVPHGSSSTTTVATIGQVASVSISGDFECPAILNSGVPTVDYFVTNGSDLANLRVKSFVMNL
jgi:hypothetical protein